MTSQSPTTEEATPAYRDAWAALSHIILEQGGSWSGRERNCAFLNTGGPRFANISALSGIDYADDARCVARIDWDQDGRLDLVVRNRTGPRLRFLRNRGLAADGRHWFALRLEGVRCNRDAIGARVFVEAGGRSLRRTLYAAEGYLCQSSRSLHFGLGRAARVDRLRVLWPDGEEQVFQDLAADQTWFLRQGGAPEPQERRSRAHFEDAEAEVVEPLRVGAARTVLHDTIPLAAMPLPAFADPGRRLGDLAGSPVLVNLWATWCPNCLQELGGWNRERERLQAAGLRIAAMSMDEEVKRDEALDRIQALGFGEGAGWMRPADREFLQAVFQEVLGDAEAGALPTSLLFDARGELCVIYHGPVEVERLLEDAALLKQREPGDRHLLPLAGGRATAQYGRDFGRLARAAAARGFEDLARSLAALAEADQRLGVGFQRRR